MICIKTNRFQQTFILFTVLLIFPVFVSFYLNSQVKGAQCPSGYTYAPRSGRDCIQTDCNDITDAHWGYTGGCVCGSSGSINENPKDPNKECALPVEHQACSNCIYACVDLDKECPDSKVVMDEQNRCVSFCERFKNKGSDQSEVLEVSGRYPNCNCIVDVKDKLGQVTQTIKIEKGDKKTTLIFDSNTGALIRKETVSMEAERQRIRDKLGFRYSEEQIDRLLENDKVSNWFQGEMTNIKTSTSLLTASYWGQHVLALLDHGFGNSADFVDIHQYGRCGDSMLWLERQLTSYLKLGEKRQEAFLSITGEDYWNITNHTSILIRPQGFNNEDWAEAVNALIAESRKKGDGLDSNEIKNIDPRILKAKVVDPYFRKETTVEEFIKGWSVIRIS